MYRVVCVDWGQILGPLREGRSGNVREWYKIDMEFLSEVFPSLFSLDVASAGAGAFP